MTKKKNILVFIDWFLPAYKAGGPVRSVANIVSAFKDEFNFFIVTSDRDFGDVDAFPEVELNVWINLHGAKVQYLSPNQQIKSNYQTIIKEVQPDLIYFNSLFSIPFTIKPLQVARKHARAKIVLAPRGMLGKGALEIKPLKKKLFLTWAKISGLYNGVVWHASTEQEVIEIKNVFGNSVSYKVAENLAIFPSEIRKRKGKNKENELTILFVSRISVKKNLELLLKAISTSENKANIKLIIVGPKEDLEYSNKCLEFAETRNVNLVLKEAMPNELLKEEYLSADIFCLPTLHENYGHVIIEAMSYSLPVLISQYTPWRNLAEQKVGFDIELNETEFTEKIDTFFLMKDEEYSSYSENAKAFAKKVIENEKVLEDNRSLFGIN